MRSLDDILGNENSFVLALDSGDKEKAKFIARRTVCELKALLQNDATGNSDEFLASVFYLSVFFRALHDFTVLKELTHPVDWFRHNQSLEAVWNKLCDCKDRFGFLGSGIVGPLVERVADALERLEQFYFTHFGQGIYMSPVLLVRREFCSVCKEDLRCCSHLCGRVYGGRLCAAIPDTTGLEIKSCDVVQVPRDLRCRIWPWQIKDNKALGVRLLSVFRIDDFTETDEWK